MGKMEDTYIFKYLQLLLYCWAAFGLPMRPCLFEHGQAVVLQSRLISNSNSRFHIKTKKTPTSKTSGRVMISS